MKIGIFDPYLDTLGGGEKYMLSAASCLSGIHDVSILWNDQSILQKAEKRFSIDLKKVKVVENIFSHNSFLKRLRLSRQFDAIFFLSDGSIPFVGCKLFVHLQFPVEWVNPNGLWKKFKLRNITKIICNSEFTKGFIDKKFGTKSVVLYPPSTLILGNESKENIILTVGRLGILPDGGYFKKQDFMINVFKKMVDKGLKDWRFALVISYKDHHKGKLDVLKKMAKEYQIDIIENADWSTLCSMYLKSKIYWHASGFKEDLNKNPERAEHFGISTVEAMSAGAIPVVINEGGQREIIDIDKNGFLWNTEEELISYTLKVIESKKMQESFSAAAKKKANDFSNQVFCQKVKEIFS
jgi:glycosyltransferase involved in cell wall biosynthesis